MQACGPSGLARTRSTIAGTAAGSTAIGVLPVPLVARLPINRVPNFSHYEAIRAENVTGASSEP
jgi:hypothetical protein